MPYTLLLADDSVTIQRVIELTFADEDVQVIAVSDGDQAIERLEASPPDIVLADIGMPGKNGYEVAQYIRQSPKLAHIPVVLLTGAFEPVDQARAAQAGCDGVLAKPFEPQLVIGRVKELLARGRRVPDALDAAFPPPSTPGDHWVPPIVDQTFGAPASVPPAPSELNDYFDRLDAAFSGLATNAPGQPAAPANPAAPPPASPSAAPTVVTDIDWFGTATAGDVADQWDLPVPASPPPDSPPDLSLSYASPAPAVPFAPLESFVPIAPVEAPAPARPLDQPAPAAPIEEPAPVALDTPASPFVPAVPPIVTSTPPAPSFELPRAKPEDLPPLADAFAALLAAEQSEPQPHTAPAWPATRPPADLVTDELIEDVTRRVLERLSDRVVRETVADIASKVTERLVREEIEKIRASIK